MKKNCVRIISILFVIMFIALGNVNSFATDNDDKKTEENKTGYTYNFSSLDNVGDSNSTVVTTTQNVMGTAITVIRIVGTGIAIIMLTFVAIKYMSAAPNEKAEFKKSAIAYVVGAIVLMGTTEIIGIIADFASNNVKLSS